MKMPEWFPGVRWRRAHAAAWAPELETDSDGFTTFARRTEAVLTARAEELGVRVLSRAVHTTTGDDGKVLESWVELKLHGSISLWVYADQCDIGGFGFDYRLEQWDALTPDALRQKALTKLQRAIEIHSSPAA
jgi:hypothetical protein